MANKKPTFVAFAALKGGTGKTTLAWNIASILDSRDKHILLMDIDTQGNMTNNFGFDVLDQSNITVGDLITKKVGEEDDLRPKYTLKDIINVAPNEKMPNTDVVIAKSDDYFSNNTLVTRGTAQTAFTNSMKLNAETLEKYDYVIIDVGANLSALAFSVLLYVDHIIMVTDPSVNGAKGCEYFPSMYRRQLRIWELEPDTDKIDTIIFNNVENSNAVEITREYLSEMHDSILDTKIPHRTLFRDGDIEGMPVLHLDMKNHTSGSARKAKKEIVESLTSLTDELIEKGVL